MYIVKSLTFRRKNYWSDDLSHMGPLEGEMELKSEKSQLQFHLTPEQTQRIIAIVAEAVVDSAKEAANILQQQVIAQVAGVELLTKD